jgi:bacteriophage N4 adsorption protein B
MDQLFNVLEIAQRELLLFSAIWLLLGGVDDFCIDLIWIGRRLYRQRAYYRHQPPMMAHQLPSSAAKGLLAVFVPAWGEASVIGAMLDNCSRSWNNSNCEYRIYVGCYPNDNASVAAAMRAASNSGCIRVVLVDHHGPSTKADCLNRLWFALLADEVAATKPKRSSFTMPRMPYIATSYFFLTGWLKRAARFNCP